ncbi:MAG: tryptophan synthase subunit alpha [Cytophagales bacterium]|nr:MAG: tryptophan synthase subunit alpha [Cytophagales bacterium]
METLMHIKNRLTDIFEASNKPLLNIYFTAGFPALEDTVLILKALEKAGVDMIEIGMPFSDPLADGPTIQESSEIALQNGMTIKKLFEQLEGIRNHISIPIMLMGYLNPVMQYGIKNFCESARKVGVDGIILPDLPFDEFNEFYAKYFHENQLSNIFLVTPETSTQRLHQIDRSASGFIYAVSTNSTTGGTKDLTHAASYFERLNNEKLNNPIMIGFNINNKENFRYACNFANGAIIGSAFIKMLKESKNIEADIIQFVDSIKN